MATKNTTESKDQPQPLAAEQLVQRSGASVSVTHSGRDDAPGEILWASTAPVNNTVEVLSEVADDQKDIDQVIARLGKDVQTEVDLSAEGQAADDAAQANAPKDNA